LRIPIQLIDNSYPTEKTCGIANPTGTYFWIMNPTGACLGTRDTTGFILII